MNENNIGVAFKNRKGVRCQDIIYRSVDTNLMNEAIAAIVFVRCVIIGVFH